MFGVLFSLTSHKHVAKPIKASDVRNMQDFVIGISQYAKKIKPGFIIIPQNGAELAFENADPRRPLNQHYLDAIDAFSLEELFYFDTLNIDQKRIDALRKLISKKKILNSDFVKNDDDVAGAKERNKKEGFVPFVRSGSNYNYEKIPTRIVDKNDADIYSMSHVRNYLYLINPGRYDTKEEFIEAIRKTDYDMVVIDVFFDGNNALTPDDIALLKDKAHGGKRLVLSYMNIGAAENWRYYWQRNWKIGAPKFLRKKYEGYDNEIYVDYSDKAWQKIIFGNDDSYVKRIIDAGFDGTYLDNTEAYLQLKNK